MSSWFLHHDELRAAELGRPVSTAIALALANDLFAIAQSNPIAPLTGELHFASKAKRKPGLGPGY